MSAFWFAVVDPWFVTVKMQLKMCQNHDITSSQLQMSKRIGLCLCYFGTRSTQTLQMWCLVVDNFWGITMTYMRLHWQHADLFHSPFCSETCLATLLTCQSICICCAETLSLYCELKLIYDRQSVGQSVLVSGTHLGPVTNFSFSLKFPLDSCEFVILYRPLWREDRSVIYCTIASGPCQSSHSWVEIP
jgi:hypothetical protein